MILRDTGFPNKLQWQRFDPICNDPQPEYEV